MAKLTVEEVLEKKYLTDVSLAARLVLEEGDPDRLTLDSDIIKAHIHQVGAYEEIYGTESDNDESNDIVFTLNGETVTYEGKPTVAASTALKSLGITGKLYVGGADFVASGKKATDLAGLALLTEHTVTWNAGDGASSVETSKVVHGSAVGTLPEVLPADGFTFSGWFDAAEEGNAVTAETTVSADVVFYAQYAEATPAEDPGQGAE